MHRLFLCFLLIFLITSPYAKPLDGSLSKEERLFYTCKVWGFLKYYHALPGRGAKDWDESLLKVFNSSKNLQTTEQFSDYLEKWIYYMGPRKKCSNCQNANTSNDFTKNLDLSWTQNNPFSGELRSALKDIEVNRFQGDHYYIGKGDKNQFEPKNENQEFSVNWKDENQRLLTLFRFWNYIEYFFPYKYQTSQSWDDVLKEMIPKFVQINNEYDYHLLLLELVNKVDDTQSTFTSKLIDQMPLFSYLPVQLEVVENQVMITKLIDKQKAQLNDLNVGDIITTINGKQAMDLHRSHYKYISGSNKAIKDRSISYTLFMGIEGTASIGFKRNGYSNTKNVSIFKYADLEQEKNRTGEAWKTYSDTLKIVTTMSIIDTVMLGYYPDDTTYIDVDVEENVLTTIGYVDMGRLNSSQVNTMMDELMDTKSIIFDVRNRPRGTHKALANHLLSEQTTFAKYIQPDFSHPGNFTWNGESTCGENKSDSSWYQGKVILLVDITTQSGAEFTCMCLQNAPNVTVVGSQTAGTIGNGSRFNMVGTLFASMTGTGVLYPDGSPIHRVGIKLDIVIQPTINGVREGKDEILEKALEIAKME